MTIKPIELVGTWDEGYALDTHTISSTYLGEDVYGNPKFDSNYSEIGKLLNSFKYSFEYGKLNEIMRLVEPFIRSWQVLQDVDFVIPVPSSKIRGYQPADEVAQKIASIINAGYSNEILHKESRIESKSLTGEAKQMLQGTIIKTKNATREHNMLLIDDIYDSGTTLLECVSVLRRDPKIKKIYVLTLTKTRTWES